MHKSKCVFLVLPSPWQVPYNPHMNISLIAAMDRNNAIGLGNTLPWHIPTDMRHFRQSTSGMHILMGRNTYDSMGKALPNRTNLVLSRNEQWNAPDTRRVSTIEEAYELAQSTNPNAPLWIIGGAQVYELAIPLASTLVLTRLDMELTVADAYFPSFSLDEWICDTVDNHTDEKTGIALAIETWTRRK